MKSIDAKLKGGQNVHCVIDIKVFSRRQECQWTVPQWHRVMFSFINNLLVTVRSRALKLFRRSSDRNQMLLQILKVIDCSDQKL